MEKRTNPVIMKKLVRITVNIVLRIFLVRKVMM